MSQGPYQNQMPPAGQPPKSGGGMSTLLIVLLVLGVLGLVCCGVCGGFTYWGAKVGSQTLIDPVMRKIQADQQVKDALGEPLTSGFPSNMKIENTDGTVDFEVTGPKGKAPVHAELTAGPNGFEPKVIKVTLPDGQVVDVPVANDPTNLNFDLGPDAGGIPMEEEATPVVPPVGENKDATE